MLKYMPKHVPRYIPNLLSAFRLCLIPVFIIFFLSSEPAHHWIPLGVFLLATVTDVLDGYIARHYNLITKIGTVLDPLADKMMLITVLTCLYLESKIPFLIISIMALKELFMILAGLYLFFIKDKIVIPANKLGKAATILFFLAIVLVLLNVPILITYTILFVALAMKFIALFSYIKAYRKIKQGSSPAK